MAGRQRLHYVLMFGKYIFQLSNLCFLLYVLINIFWIFVSFLWIYIFLILPSNYYVVIAAVMTYIGSHFLYGGVDRMALCAVKDLQTAIQ